MPHPTRLTRPIRVAFFVCAALLWPASWTAAATFDAPLKFTDGARNYRMTRNAGKQMAFDTSGTLHLTYWAGLFQTTPANTSAIYHRQWTPAGGFTPQVRVDESVGAGSQELGGRQPSLAVAPDGTAHIVWHDHRHGTSGGNWIDNIEIYADRLAPGGAFIGGDLRLTATAAGHGGDNGYNPAIAAAADGTLSVLWYDFNDGGFTSDLYMSTSDAAGAFATLSSLAAARLSDEADRAPNPPSFTMVDVAIDGDGRRHVVWSEGTGPAAPLHYAELGATPQPVTATQLAAATDGFFRPAKVAVGPGGEVWVVYTDRSGAGRRIGLRHKPAGGAFEPAVLLPAAAEQRDADLAIDRYGRVHLVWEDLRAGQSIRYGRFDAAAGAVVDEAAITTAAPPSGEWTKPSIVLDADGQPRVMFGQFEDDIEGSLGDIWFAAGAIPNAADEAWTRYE